MDWTQKDRDKFVKMEDELKTLRIHLHNSTERRTSKELEERREAAEAAAAPAVRFRFVLCCGGFVGAAPELGALYERSAPIAMPSLHVVGEGDGVAPGGGSAMPVVPPPKGVDALLPKAPEAPLSNTAIGQHETTRLRAQPQRCS